MSGTIRKAGKLIQINSSYNKELVEEIKEIQGRRYHAEDHSWTVPLDAASEAIALGKKYDLKIEAGLTASAEQARQETEQRVALSTAATAEPIESAIGKALRPYQTAGVRFMLATPKSINADDMGLGKTIQALATLETAEAYPALIVCPASVALNWRAEANRWVPGRKVQVIKKGTDKLDSTADITVATYDLAKKMVPDLLERHFNATIADESHYLKNSKAQRTKALEPIIEKSPRAHMLTGTPITNRPSDLVSPLRMLGYLDDLGGWRTFVTHYCNGHQTKYGWDISGASNLGELNQKLRQKCLVRRKKGDVLTELPPKARTLQTVEVAMGDYKAKERELLKKMRENAEAENKEVNMLGELATLRRAAGIAKIPAAVETVGEYVEADRKVVVFAHHLEVLDGIQHELPTDKVVRIDGSVTKEARQAAIDKFQNDPNKLVFLSSTQAGGVGITLTAASDVIIVEQEWVAADMDQAEDRCHRIGQTSSVNAIHLLAANTIDEKLSRLVAEKRDIAEKALDGSTEKLAATKSVQAEVLEEYRQQAGIKAKPKKRSEGHQHDSTPSTAEKHVATMGERMAQANIVPAIDFNDDGMRIA